MRYQIIVPLCSTDVLLELESDYKPVRAFEPDFYPYVTSNAFGAVKVFVHKIQDSDPMKITIEKLQVSPSQWGELIKENELVLAQIRSNIARLDTDIAQKVLAMGSLQRMSHEYLEVKMERDTLTVARHNLIDRKYINEALTELVKRSNEPNPRILFIL